MEGEVLQRYTVIAELADNVIHSLHDEAEKLGFNVREILLQTPEEADYRLSRDPANGAYSLVGIWRNEQGMKQGELLFHSDGSFMVEYDVAKPHPKRKQWFVESLCAWGKDALIKSEAKLLPMPE